MYNRREIVAKFVIADSVNGQIGHADTIYAARRIARHWQDDVNRPETAPVYIFKTHHVETIR